MLWSAFLLGFFGSFHCAGMCGPIALALPSGRGQLLERVGGRMLYNLGRTLTYALMGGVIGFFGQAVLLVADQVYFSYTLGAILIVLGIFAVNLDHLVMHWGGMQRFYAWIQAQLGRVLGRQQMRSLLVVGMLNGFLPCGLVYVALLGAVAAGDHWGGALYMFLFGLGTVPMMLGLSLAGNYIGLRWRNRMRKLYPVLFVLMGILLIVRAWQTTITDAGVSCH